MAKVPKNVRIVTDLFTLFYCVVFIHLLMILSKTMPRHVTVITSLLFVSVLIGFLAAKQLKEWGRKLVITLMVVLSVYFGIIMLNYPGMVHPGYIIISIVAILFFNQKKIRFRFQSTAASSRRSILIIDDDEGIQKAVQKILLKKGYSVLTATTGERGLQVARVQKPDLILLDVILPGIKGREVCGILKEDVDTKDIPVVFLTAKDSPDDIDAELAAGAVSHLTKPVDAKLLVAEIKKLLK